MELPTKRDYSHIKALPIAPIPSRKWRLMQGWDRMPILHTMAFMDNAEVEKALDLKAAETMAALIRD